MLQRIGFFPLRIPYRLSTSTSIRSVGTFCSIRLLRFIDILKLIRLMQFPKVSAPFRLYSGFFLIWAKRRGYREGVGAVFSTRTTRWVMDVPGMV